jgi:hypothetical protein
MRPLGTLRAQGYLHCMKHTLPIMTLIATAAFLVSPFLADPFTGFDPNRFPVPQLDPPVQPAGYAFAIWGLIYAWLAVLAVVGVSLRRTDAAWQPVHLPLTLSLGPGALWLWVAGFAPLAATVLIFWMLGCAIWALLRTPAQDRWLLRVPVALYAGWLTAAAHVSLGVAIGGYGLASGEGAAIMAVAGATLVALVINWLRPDAPEYSAAVIWAFIAVIVANMPDAVPVAGATLVALVLVAALTARGLWAGQARA